MTPDSAWAGSQPWTAKGERSGLWTRMATESVSSCVRDEIVTAFLELERAIHEFAVSLISWSTHRNMGAEGKLAGVAADPDLG